MEAVIGIILVMLVVFGLIIYSAFSWGFVTYKFYYWFVLWLFPELPLITFWQAVAVSMLLSLFKNHTQTEVKDEYKDSTATTINILIHPWLVIFAGWVIHSIIV